MTYSESFLSTCDAEGNAPPWAIKQIFKEHSASIEDYYGPNGYESDNGEAILEWLGY